ncbi:transposase [Bradyrhizobium pachyrhizi]|uniref:transposase n=1 Tax=Bradyrhizobium pachyrhizi TaxID=280333 RepID=UPI0018DFC7F3|nr:transposase [Bradyrhizobium pachyrhizi]
MLADLIDASSLPESAYALFCSPASTVKSQISTRRSRDAFEDEVLRRLMTVPGIGSISATAITALAPPDDTIARGSDFTAWLGFTPRQRSTGGKQKFDGTSKMGERTLRRLLIIGTRRVAHVNMVLPATHAPAEDMRAILHFPS